MSATAHTASLHSAWTTGVVTSLTGGSYRGRVKHVHPYRDPDDQPSPEGETRP